MPAYVGHVVFGPGLRLTYLFIEPAYGKLIDQRLPGLADWIRRHYDGAVVPQGIWYRERDRHSHLNCVATLRHPCS